jgi:hypothetical protein
MCLYLAIIRVGKDFRMNKLGYEDRYNIIPLTDLRLAAANELDTSSAPELNWSQRLGRSGTVAGFAIAAVAAFPGAALAKRTAQKSNTGQEITAIQSGANDLYTFASPDILPVASSADGVINQQNLNNFGEHQVNEIVGFNMNFTQRTIGVTSAEGSLTTTFECPPTDNPKNIEIQSIKVNPSNKANVEFCPSLDNIVVTKPNTSDPTYPNALEGFLNDPLRQGQWGGDEYQKNNNLYYECPLEPLHQDPRFKLKYSRTTGKLNVAMDGSNASKYCNETGMETDRVTGQVVEVTKKGKRHVRNVGRSALIINGLDMPLVYGYGLSFSQVRERGNITEIGDICVDKSRKIKSVGVRAKVKESYRPDHAQDFVHDHQGGTFPMRSMSKTYTSRTKKTC